MSSGWYYTPQAPNGYSTTSQNGGVVNPHGGGVNYYASGYNADGSQQVNDPNNFKDPTTGNATIQEPEYGGGRLSSSNTTAMQYGNLAASAQSRAGTQLAHGLVNQDRSAGIGALQLQQQAAQGNAPSAAAMQMSQANAQTVGAQMAAMNSGSPNGGALQNAQAQAGGYAMQGQNIAQGGGGRAQEMAQARADYGQQALGLQGLDQNYAAQQATINAQQQEENDKTSLDYSGLANQVQLGQLTADTAAYNGRNSNYQQMNQHQADLTNNMISGASQAAPYVAAAFL